RSRGRGVCGGLGPAEAPAGLNRGGGVRSLPASWDRFLTTLLRINSIAHAVMQFDIKLEKHIGIEDTGFGYVPDSGGLDDVLNDELLNGLVFGRTLGAVSARSTPSVAPSPRTFSKPATSPLKCSGF
uniref:Uncharacterized protein n=1 Tax=Peromyscus maniculatus bairdii TaxID=230844 RepID=A0A8C8ULK3_PERMB